MLPSLAFWYIPLLFPPFIKRRLFYSEFLTQILYISCLPLFPIYFTNPCCHGFVPWPPFPTSVPSPCSQPFSLPLFRILVSKLCSIPLLPTPVSNSFFNPCSPPSILVPCSLFPSSFSLHMLQPLFPTFFHLPRFPASVHYSCSQPLFLILASNFCCLSLFPVCFNLFPTPVPNLQSQLLPPNGKFDCSSFCILQARVAFDKKEFQKAETFLLRAQRPELSARYYKVP